jgi:hypothetical protein
LLSLGTLIRLVQPAIDRPGLAAKRTMANEIAMNLEALVGTAEEPAPNVEPMHPVSDTTSKFANLQFGRNYDPNNR